MNKMIKLSVLVMALVSSQAMALKSQFVCDIPLFNGYSKDNKARFIVCESGGEVAMTLVDVNKNKLLADLRVPKLFTGMTYKDRTKLFTIMAGPNKEDGGFGYVETEVDGDPYRILLIKLKDSEQISVVMAKPKHNALNRSLTQYGIQVNDQ